MNLVLIDLTKFIVPSKTMTGCYSLGQLINRVNETDSKLLKTGPCCLFLSSE